MSEQDCPESVLHEEASENQAAAMGMETLVRRVLWVMLLAVLVYGALVVYQGLNDVVSSFARFEWWTFAAACGLALVNYLLRFLKWEYYLGVLNLRGIPKLESLLTFLSGFVLTVSPGKVGEVFKSLVLFKTRGVAIERTAPIVVAERLTDLIGVIVMIAVGSLGLPGGLLWASAGTALVLFILGFFAIPAFSRPVLAMCARLPRVGAALVPKVEKLLESGRLLTSPRTLLWPTLLSVLAWSLEGVGLWLILQGFQQDTSMGLAAFFYATATLAGALIPVPGGLGVTDGLLEQQLHSLGGVATGPATAAMLLIRLATLWFAVVVGFGALAALRALNPRLGLTPRATNGSRPSTGKNHDSD